MVKRDILLEDFKRKLDLMRIAAYAIASGENPRMTLVRMDSKFASPLITEDKALDMATAMFNAIKPKGVDLNILLSVDHKNVADRLLVKLLFYVMYARREGKQNLDRFMPYLGSRFFPKESPSPSTISSRIFWRTTSNPFATTRLSRQAARWTWLWKWRWAYVTNSRMTTSSA